MKKSKLFMAAGGLVLAISAVFAVKANKKFTFSFQTGSYDGIKVVAPGAIFTHQHGTGLVTAIVTIIGTPGSFHGVLFTDVSGAKTLYVG